MHRSCTVLFGSVCFGALLEAIVQAIRYIVAQQERRVSERGGSPLALFCLCCAHCLLTCIGDILEYFNSYAYVYVAKHEHTYLESAKEVYNMFKNNGVLPLINDSVINAPFNVGAFILLLLVIGMSVFAFNILQINAIAIGISAVLSLVLYFTIINVLQAYVKTAFVAWANNKRVFESREPGYHALINERAQEALAAAS